MPEQLSTEEERLFRAYNLGKHDVWNETIKGLDLILRAVESDEAYDAAVESVEERLQRQLDQERQALRVLRAERIKALAEEPDGLLI